MFGNELKCEMAVATSSDDIPSNPPQIEEMAKKSRRKGDRLRRVVNKLIGRGKKEEEPKPKTKPQKPKKKSSDDDPGWGMGV